MAHCSSERAKCIMCQGYHLCRHALDESKVHARYDNGVLEVTVEGAAAVREPKHIQIEGPSS